MLSGSLILPQGHDDLRKVSKRVAKVGVPLVVWSLIFLGWFAASSPNWLHAPSVKFSIGQIFRSPVMTHLWFLYTLIGLYLFVPVLQAFFQNSDRSMWYLYLGAAFIGASIVPFVFDLTGVRLLGIDLAYFPIYAAYMMLGAVVSCLRVGIKWSAAFLAVAILSGGITSLLTAWATFHNGSPVETFYAYSSPFVVLASVGFFVGLRGLGAAAASFSRFERVIATLAPLSFGAYILHPLVLYYMFKTGLSFNTGGAWTGIPLASVLIFGVVCIIVAALRSTKISRWLVPN